MNKLVHGTFVNLQEIINTRNKEGRTALHLAVAGNTQSNLVELLKSALLANLNICDTDGMTPLDLLTRRAPSGSSEILIKQLISAGGISNATDCLAQSTFVSQLKMRGTGSSPGTSFRIIDSEIILYADIEKVSDVIGERGNARPSSCSSTSKCEVSNLETVIKHHGQSGSKKPSSINYAARRLKSLLGCPHQKNKNTKHFAVEPIRLLGDKESLESFKKLSNLEDLPTPLKERFSKPSSLPNNKRTHVRSYLPTNFTRKKCDTGPSHNSLYATPHSALLYHSPYKSPLPSSPTVLDKQKGVVYDYEIGEPSTSKISV